MASELTRFNEDVLSKLEKEISDLESRKAGSGFFMDGNDGSIAKKKKELEDIRKFTEGIQSKQPGVRQQTSALVPLTNTSTSALL